MPLQTWLRHRTGRHFLHIPGPTNIPTTVLRATTQPGIDLEVSQLAALKEKVARGLATVFGSTGEIITFTGSGTGACEAALLNTLSPGEAVLMAETGHFACAWYKIALRHGFTPTMLPGDWRHGADPDKIFCALSEDKGQKIRAVAIVHNETSTGVVSCIKDIRSAMNRIGHEALLLVDSISGVGAMNFCQHGWGVDVLIASSQKGLMLPPGLGINSVSDRALRASSRVHSSRFTYDWHRLLDREMLGDRSGSGSVPLLRGLVHSLELLIEHEGLEAVYARHSRLAEATRLAVQSWELTTVCAEPRNASPTVTAVYLPTGYSADELRRCILNYFDLSLGSGLGRLSDKVFRIAHLGSLNSATLIAVLCGVEMGLGIMGVPHRKGGAQAALQYLSAYPGKSRD
jgi:alanine-glyoxylate transaminase/serine-glyoxylate transaminase/serine-pyruvate transaminase